MILKYTGNCFNFETLQKVVYSTAGHCLLTVCRLDYWLCIVPIWKKNIQLASFHLTYIFNKKRTGHELKSKDVSGLNLEWVKLYKFSISLSIKPSNFPLHILDFLFQMIKCDKISGFRSGYDIDNENVSYFLLFSNASVVYVNGSKTYRVTSPPLHSQPTMVQNSYPVTNPQLDYIQRGTIQFSDESKLSISRSYFPFSWLNATENFSFQVTKWPTSSITNALGYAS